MCICATLNKMVHPGGLLALRLALRAVADATLSPHEGSGDCRYLIRIFHHWYGEYGASGEDSNLKPLGS